MTPLKTRILALALAFTMAGTGLGTTTEAFAAASAESQSVQPAAEGQQEDLGEGAEPGTADGDSGTAAGADTAQPDDLPADEAASTEDELTPAELLEQAGLDLDALLETARHSGGQAAAVLNALQDDEHFAAGVRQVLILYYGEALAGELANFTAAIDGRAAAQLEKFAQADAERADVQLDYVAGEVLVVFEPEVDEPEAEAAVAAVVEAEPAEVADSTTLLQQAEAVALVAEIALDQTVAEAVEQFEAEAGVAYAQPNYIYHTAEADQDAAALDLDPSDSQYQMGNMWQVPAINTLEAWELLEARDTDGVQREPVVVAVIDTPVLLDHEDLADNLLLEHAWDFSTGTKQPLTFSSSFPPGRHGTHVAGLVGAVANNAKGVLGTASGMDNTYVKIMPLNVFTYTYVNGSWGYNGATSSNLSTAIIYAVENGAQVINLSLGLRSDNDTFIKAGLEAADAAGVTVVAAAGNANSTLRYLPADYDEVISVINLKKPESGNTYTQSDTYNPRASSSNYSGKDIAAPGTSVYSTGAVETYPIQTTNYYLAMSGTSMASPIVAGVVALLLYASPGLEPDDIRALLKLTATDVYTAGYDEETSWGSVNAEAAVNAALSSPVLTAPKGLAAVQRAGGDLLLSWNPVVGADGYLVYDATAGEDAAPLATLTDLETTWLDAGTAPGDIGTTRKYRVLAFIELGGTLYPGQAATLSATRAAPAPAGLEAMAVSEDSVTLGWQAVDGTEAYLLYRSQRADGGFALVATTTDLTYTDSDMRMDRAYYYKVSSQATRGGQPVESEGSDLRASTLLTDPDSLSATLQRGGSVLLQWQALPAGVQMCLERSKDDAEAWTALATLAAGTTSYTDSHQLDTGSVYHYRLHAMRTVDDKPELSAGATVQSILMLLVEPTNLAVTTSYGQARLTWQAPAGNTQPDGYYIYRMVEELNGGEAQLVGKVPADSLTYTDYAYWPLGSYAWAVAGYVTQDGAEAAGLTSDTLAVSDSAYYSQAPLGLVAVSLGAAGSRLSWDGWPEHPLAGLLEYQVFRSDSPDDDTFVQVGTTTELTFTDPGLRELGYYCVKAALPGGPFSQSTAVAKVEYRPTMAGLALQAEPAAYNALRLSWERNPEADGYYIYRRTAGGTAWQLAAIYRQTAADSGSATWLNSALTSGTVYEYRVQCFINDADGQPLLSADWLDAAATARPLAPDGFTAEASAATSVRLSWSATAGATGYRLYRLLDGEATLLRTLGKSTALTLKNLTLGERYTYELRAIRKQGGVVAESDATAARSVELQGGDVAHFAANSAGQHQMRLTWDALAGASGYKLYRTQLDEDGQPTAAAELVKTVNNAATETFLHKGVPAGRQLYTIVPQLKVNGLKTDGTPATATDLVAGWTGSAPDVTATAGTDTHQVQLEWTEVDGAAGYAIWRVQPDGTSWLVTTVRASRLDYLDNKAAGGQWYYAVTAYITVGGKRCEGPQGLSEQVNVASITGAVGAFNAAAAGAYTVQLNWTAAAYATGYNLYRATSAGIGLQPVYTLVKKLGVTYSYTDTVPAGSYYYLLCPVAGSARLEGPYADAVFVTAEALAAPVVRAPTSTALHTLEIQWAAVPGAGGYTVRYAPANGSAAAKSKTLKTTSLKLTGLEAGAYDITVHATATVAGQKVTGPAAEAVSGSPRQLAAPADLSVQLPATGYNTVQLSWAPVTSDDASGAATPSGYAIYRAGEEKPFKYVNAKTTSFTDKNAPTGAVEYRVAAYRTVGGKRLISAAAATASTLVPGLAAVQGVQISPATHGATLSWDAVEGAAGYLIKRATAADGSFETVATVKRTNAADRTGNYSATDAGVPAGPAYYQVVAYHGTAKQEGEAHWPLNVEIAELEAVQHFTATATDALNTVALSWQPVEGARGYTLYRRTGLAGEYDQLATVKRSAKESTVGYRYALTLKNQPSGEGYYYIVPTATHKKLSYYGTATAAGAPVQVTSLPSAGPVSAQEAGSLAVKLNWTKVPGATGYLIRYGTATDIEAFSYTVKGSGKTTATVPVLANGGYTFTVSAYYKNISMPGAGSTATAQVSWAEGLCTLAAPVAGPNQIAFVTAGGATATDLKGFKLYVNGALYKTVSTTKSRTNVWYGAEGQYEVRVTYYRNVGGTVAEHTCYSGTLSVTDPAWPSGGGLLTASQNTDTLRRVTLSWQPVAGVTGYELYRAASPTGSGTRVKTVSQGARGVTQLSTTITLPAEGSYYYTLRPIVKSGGKTYTGPASIPLQLGFD